MADYRFHAEVSESAGVKQSCAILVPAEDLRQRGAGSGGIGFARAVERRVCGAEDREEALDTLRINGVGVIEYDRESGECGEMRHRVAYRAVKSQVLGGRRLQADQDDVAAGGGSLK